MYICLRVEGPSPPSNGDGLSLPHGLAGALAACMCMRMHAYACTCFHTHAQASICMHIEAYANICIHMQA